MVDISALWGMGPLTGEDLTRVIERYGWSVTTAANYVRCSRSTIHRWMSPDRCDKVLPQHVEEGVVSAIFKEERRRRREAGG